MRKCKMMALALMSLAIGGTSIAQTAVSNPAPVAADAQLKADNEQEKKAEEWVAALNLDDPAKAARVKKVIATHLNTIRDWNNNHPFTTVPDGINPATGNKLSDLDRQIIANSAMPASVHADLMTGLRKELTED